MQKAIRLPRGGELSNAYICASFSLPQELRARLPLEEAAIEKLSMGRNIAIRGFGRIGKSELMRGAICGSCERFSGSGAFFDLGDGLGRKGALASEAEALAGISSHLQEFYAACGMDCRIDPSDPLRSLGNVKEQFYLGIDGLVALHALGEDAMGRIIGMMKSLPGNIRLVAVCNRHRDVDGIFEREFGSDGGFDTIYVPPITDEEAERLISGPASALGYSFSPEALAALMRKSGGRPWELFIYAFLAADRMERLGVKEAGGGFVEEAVQLRTAAGCDAGTMALDSYARSYLFAMNDAERDAARRIALGCFEEKPSDNDGLITLLQGGWIRRDGPWEISGTMFRDFIRSLERGEIGLSGDSG